MVGSLKPVIKVTELEQLGFIVRNVDKTMDAMWTNFGIGPWNITVVKADAMSSMTYLGKPARFGYKVAKPQKRLGSVEIELIEPTEGEGLHHAFLREHGEGIEHLGWHKLDSLEAMAETTRHLEKEGFPCLMSGRNAYCAFAYFDTTRVLNTILETIWWDPTATPRPTYTFPG